MLVNRLGLMIAGVVGAANCRDGLDTFMWFEYKPFNLVATANKPEPVSYL